MGHTYRIDGSGDAAAFLEAGDMANDSMIDRAEVGGTTHLLTWFNYLLSAAGAAAMASLVLQPLLGGVPALSGGAIVLAGIPLGVGAYVLALVVMNRWIARGMARAFLADPMIERQHVLLSRDGLRVVSGQTHTLIDWSDVTKIEASAKVIVVCAGYSWAYVPLSSFPKPDDAKAALADMRAWQAAARA